MRNQTSNIEPIAREICSKIYSRVDISSPDLAATVDRYWHCVAAELETGQIDEAGNQIETNDIKDSLAAYRDWCQRHPESK